MGNGEIEEKKLLGSGGYAIAKLTGQEESRANVGVPQIFLANVGRLTEDSISKYYCNKCTTEYAGPPLISYENPNEVLGEGVILIEKGEYKCKVCNSMIAYRKFNKYKCYLSNNCLLLYLCSLYILEHVQTNFCNLSFS